jgi:hypothetical protein
VGYIYPILTKIGLNQQSLIKLPNIKFHKNSFSNSQVNSWALADKEISIGAQQGC